MDLTLIVKDNCNACARVELALRNLAYSNKEIMFSVINIKDSKEFKTQIVPALFVNQELYSYGDINDTKLLAYLKKQFEQGACNRAVYKSN
jgi:alkyl hydroperoxide reductase subunit AhpF